MFLQSVAWMGMMVNYSQGAPIAEALAKTFSGAHPCELCKAVKEGKATEQKQDLTKKVVKLDLACPGSKVLLDPPSPFPRIARIGLSFSPRGQAPPTPPPRAG